MHLRKLAVAAALCAVATTATSCDSGHTIASTSTTTSARATDQPPIPLPGAADLNAGMLIMLDPNSSSAHNPNVVQGADADPDLIHKMAQAGVNNGLKITVVQVAYAGNGLMQATANLTLNGKPVDGQTVIPFVADGGRWKLQQAWACQMLANAQVTSPACP